jgi:hypothetical protein
MGFVSERNDDGNRWSPDLFRLPAKFFDLSKNCGTWLHDPKLTRLSETNSLLIRCLETTDVVHVAAHVV